MAVWRPTWQDIINMGAQTWAQWPWDTWLGPYTVIAPRRYRARVRVWRAGEWVDITSRVASGVIRESNDQPVATLELRLLNGRQYPSLAPRRKDSPLNRVNGQYVPLLWIGRLIAVEAAFSEDGSEPDEWWPVFLGELEDEIDTESGPDGTYVRLFCRDMATRLQRAYIAGPKTYENMYASQMIQAILDDAYSEGLIPEPVTLRVIGVDDFWVERYDIEYTDLWSALQRFCQQRGTDLRYRLNEATGQIELTYWLPDRAMVPRWIIDASQIRREELRISGTDIINRVTVRYRDAQTGQRAEVTVQDEDSIAMYGLRHGLIEEPDTDLIPDEETARKLAQTIVEDLKDVPALTRITCPFDPRIQLFDKLRVANPSVRDEPEDYAIEARELSFTATDWSMVLVGGARVVVKRQVWLERLAKEGVKQPFTPGDWITNSRPPAVIVTLSTGLEEVAQTATAFVKASWTRPNWHWVDRYAVRIRRIGTNEYQYQETKELSATFYGLVAGVEYGVQVAAIDGRGVIGEPSQEVTITTPKDPVAPATPTGLTVTTHLRGVEARINPNTEPDLRRYIWEKSVNGGAWEVFARDLVTARVIPAQAGQTVSVRVSAEDWSGNVSPPTMVVSAVAGQVGTDDIEPGAITGNAVLLVTDMTGTSTTSTTPVDIPGFQLTFNLAESAFVLVMMRVSLFIDNVDVSHGLVRAFTYLNVDGQDVRGQAINVTTSNPGDLMHLWAPIVIFHAEQLPAGTHTFKGRFQVSEFSEGCTAIAYHRELIAVVLKR